MQNIKTINVFTQGDSSKISTWSNLPYFFTKSLEELGYKVNRIDILPEETNLYKKYEKIWNKYIAKVINRLFPGNIYTIDRSCFFRYLVKRNIYQALKQNSDVDLNIFLTYSYIGKIKNIPSLLICDFTYEEYIIKRLNRQLKFIEKIYAIHEKNNIKNADVVVCTYGLNAKSMSLKYKKDINYPDRIALNINFERQINENDILKIKETSNKILFIGNQNNIDYVNSAKRLIGAFKLLGEHNYDYELHIIGISEDKLTEYLNNKIYCYGYLDKEYNIQSDLYYRLLFESKLFVNLSGSMQAMIEAMYFYTPIITSKFNDTLSELGEEINFGEYCFQNDELSLLNSINNVLKSSTYSDKCIEAHHFVKSGTWIEYTKKVLTFV